LFVSLDIILRIYIILLELPGGCASIGLFGDFINLFKLIEVGSGLLVGGHAQSFCAKSGFSLDKSCLSSRFDL